MVIGNLANISLRLNTRDMIKHHTIPQNFLILWISIKNMNKQILKF